MTYRNTLSSVKPLNQFSCWQNNSLQVQDILELSEFSNQHETIIGLNNKRLFQEAFCCF